MVPREYTRKLGSYCTLIPIKMTCEALITAIVGHSTLFAFRDRYKKALAWEEVSRGVGWSGELNKSDFTAFVTPGVNIELTSLATISSQHCAFKEAQ